MTRWVIGLILGLVVIGAVYILRERAIREEAGIDEIPSAVPGGVDEERQARGSPQAPGGEAPAEADARPVDTTTAPESAAPDEQALAEATAGLVTVSDAWARESTPLGTTAVYMVLIPDERQPDRLIGARSSAAQSVEIHESRIERGVATMARIEGLDLEPDTPVAFEAGGLHLMVVGLKRPLKTGDSLPLVLEFAKSGKITLEVRVGEPTGGNALGHVGGD